MSHNSRFLTLLGALTLAASMTACGGGSQTPPESPEPSTEPAEAPSSPEAGDAGTGDTHTMPDGTEMSGHQHDEGGDKPEKK